MAAATDPSQQPASDPARMGEVPLAERVVEAVLFTPFEIAGALATEPIKQWDSASKQIRQEISNARVIGKMALTFGAKRLRSDIEQRLSASTGSSADARLSSTTPPQPAEPQRSAAPTSTEPPSGSAAASASEGHDDAEDGVAAAMSADESTRSAGAIVDAEELALPDYDSLAASNIVRMLGGLTADELDAVEQYELAHRARRTVLGKIGQLRDELGAQSDD